MASNHETGLIFPYLLYFYTTNTRFPIQYIVMDASLFTEASYICRWNRHCCVCLRLHKSISGFYVVSKYLSKYLTIKSDHNPIIPIIFKQFF